jgi:hypothetical protein
MRDPRPVAARPKGGAADVGSLVALGEAEPPPVPVPSIRPFLEPDLPPAEPDSEPT